MCRCLWCIFLEGSRMMAKWCCLGIKCDGDSDCLKRCSIEVNPTLVADFTGASQLRLKQRNRGAGCTSLVTTQLSAYGWLPNWRKFLPFGKVLFMGFKGQRIFCGRVFFLTYWPLKNLHGETWCFRHYSWQPIKIIRLYLFLTSFGNFDRRFTNLNFNDIQIPNFCFFLHFSFSNNCKKSLKSYLDHI